MNLNTIKFSEIIETFKNNDIEFLSTINENETFSGISTIESSSSEDLSFFSNSKYLKKLENIKAKACIIEKKFSEFLPESCKPIIVKDAYFCLAILSKFIEKTELKSNGKISKNTYIDKDSKISKNFQLNSFSSIYSNTHIKENVYVGSNSNIGPNVTIHKNVIIHDNVSISNSIIFDDCEIQSGARIGSSGFGFEEKTKKRIYHHGNVIIKKNSNIGCNTTIDRSVFESTVIGEFSQIDNLVQIAHNVIIGDHAIIASQVGIAGSTKIGNNVKIGGQAGVSGHLTIGDNVTIAGKSGVTKNISDNRIVAGFPAKDINIWKKEIIKNSLKK